MAAAVSAEGVVEQAERWAAHVQSNIDAQTTSYMQQVWVLCSISDARFTDTTSA